MQKCGLRNVYPMSWGSHKMSPSHQNPFILYDDLEYKGFAPTFTCFVTATLREGPKIIKNKSMSFENELNVDIFHKVI